MYRAKRAGGNQWLSMSAEIGALASDDNEMERSLRRALRQGTLELRFQPLYEIAGAFHSLEALVRLPGAEHDFIPPHRFIPIAEERGLIVPLGDWVLNEVCRQSARWQREGLPPVRIALNISPLQITRPDFAARVAEVLASHNVSPHLIVMEITETAMMRNLAEASRQMSLLAASGVLFSVDDFGTGYSSLGQLDTLPVQCLKIDRTFIERICLSDGTFSIVDAMVSMAHSLRLEVVAEGVENSDQWECLRRLHCDIVQGYLFSQPLTNEETAALMRAQSEPRDRLARSAATSAAPHATPVMPSLR
jgi:EAL domain-containing protein (putative c-di-GMP-specific phosphodiesterase class I)